MKIKCTRPVMGNDGISEIVFYFDTETLEIEFDKKDIPLLVAIYKQGAIDIPELSDFEIVN